MNRFDALQRDSGSPILARKLAFAFEASDTAEQVRAIARYASLVDGAARMLSALDGRFFTDLPDHIAFPKIRAEALDYLVRYHKS